MLFIDQVSSLNSSLQVTIALGDEAAASSEPTEKKEKPIWMVESTIEGASSENTAVDDVTDRRRSAVAGSDKTSKEDEAIMQTLLAHEKKRNSE